MSCISCAQGRGSRRGSARGSSASTRGRTSCGRSLRVDLKEPRALDHAYAVTSHRSQGLSRERVYLTVDTSHSEELVNRRQFYVSVSRAVEDARVYTDNRLALSRVVSREQGRESALEVLDRVPRRSRAELLRSETPLDVGR